jgi:hypothetical protein
VADVQRLWPQVAVQAVDVQ